MEQEKLLTTKRRRITEKFFHFFRKFFVFQLFGHELTFKVLRKSVALFLADLSLFAQILENKNLVYK